MNPFMIFIVGIFFLFGCVAEESMIKWEEIGPDPTVYFCKQDNCSKHLEELFLSAQSSIHCAIFDLELPNLVKALEQKSQTVDVRLVVDNEFTTIDLSSLSVKEDKRSPLMHNKFCIVDNMHVWTGSFNPTHNGNDLNENNALIFSSPYLARNYEEEFFEMWNGQFGKQEQTIHSPIVHNSYEIENLFCPDDLCEDKVVSLIENAQYSVHFMLFSFTSTPIADALLFNTDIDIKGIMDSSQAGNRFSQLKRLQEFGLDIRKDKVKGKLHHKVFIIDNTTVVTGSYNPSKSGAFINDENVVIIHHKPTAQQYVDEFDRLFALS